MKLSRKTWLGLFRWRVIWTSPFGGGRLIEQGVTGSMRFQTHKPAVLEMALMNRASRRFRARF